MASTAGTKKREVYGWAREDKNPSLFMINKGWEKRDERLGTIVEPKESGKGMGTAPR